MRSLIFAALAATSLFVASSAARAQEDTFRLGGPSAEADIQGGTDTELVYYRGGYGRGFYGGGYGGWGRGYGGWGRGYAGYGGWGRGYYGGWGRGWYGGYGRGLYAGYYGRGWGLGYYGGWGGGYYGGYPYYTSSYYYPSYYYTPTYYNSVPYCSDYYYGISGDSAPTQTLQALQALNGGSSALSQRLLPFSADGTYPYNGGPQFNVPMPSAPGIKLDRGPLPIEGKLVTLPTETRGGFSPVTTPEIQRLRYVTTPVATTPARVQYPAYGER